MGFSLGLDQNALRNLMSKAVKKYLCLIPSSRESFKDFELNSLNFSNFDHSLDFFASFLHPGRKEEPAWLKGMY